MAVLAVLAAALGADHASADEPAALAPNVVPLTVRTPHFGFNRLLVSVTVCAPGTMRCATIDDIMVDTGSTGLRLEAAAVPPALGLPPKPGPDGKPLAECVRYLHDAAWGRILRADVHIGGMVAADLPVHVIADAKDRPATCAVSGAPSTSNGTLGIGPHLTDCGGACVQSPQPIYFTCGDGACVPIPDRVAEADRMPNPVTSFKDHGNGIVIDLPPAPAGGAKSIEGTLTFGVGTAPNNALGAASILRVNTYAYFTTHYAGRTYPESYIDSGSETYVVPDATLPRCPSRSWAFCLSPERRLSATLIGTDGAQIATAFSIGDWEDVGARGVGADGAIAMAAPVDAWAFVWGAPFFLGKRVFVVMEGKAVRGRADLLGPFYAFR